jgi:hypothetical protein
MHIFDHPNPANFVCPICKTAEDKPVVLVGIEGTEDGHIMKARQYHLACIDLTEIAKGDFLFQRIPTCKH